MKAILDRLMKKWLVRDPRLKLKQLLEAEMEKNHPVVLFYIDVIKLSDLEIQYGLSHSSHIIKTLNDLIERAATSTFTYPAKYLVHHRLWGDDFSIYVSWEKAHNRQQTQESLHQLCISFKERIETLLNKQISLPGNQRVKIHIGFSRLEGNDIHQEIYKAVKSASQMAKYDVQTEEFFYHRQFFQIIETEDLQSYYQPLISLKDGSTFGWEGLIRGPEGTTFFLPHRLFEYAEKTRRSLLLDSLCRRKVLERIDRISPNQKLFVNIDPRCIEDTSFLRKDAIEWLERHGLSPHNIVLEITERHAITDVARFQELIRAYRKVGYQIAVDDAGAGYSSLETIVQTYPDFIKLDMSLTRGIDYNPVKRAIVEAFVTFARKVGCKIIAEGIETKNELHTLIELQVDLGQGYFLGRPANGLCNISGQGMSFFESLQLSGNSAKYRPRGIIKSISMFSSTFPPETKVKRIHQMFEENPRLDHVVVTDREKPIGLVMKQHLYQVLGGQYGIPLYHDKDIQTLMDTSPLIVDQYSTIEEVSKAAMARDPNKIYDVVIVTHEGKYFGSITVQRLLDTIAQAKLEWAVFTNPLSQLPGNILIDREIENRINQEEYFHVVYCDLDHFKLFNDTYGFDQGDQIIVETAELMKRMVKTYGTEHDFVGHIGGDDFILITGHPHIHELVDCLREEFMTHFAAWVCQDGNCDPVCLSMSMAAIECRPGRFKKVSEISALAAKVKKLAKSRTGCSFAADRELGFM